MPPKEVKPPKPVFPICEPSIAQTLYVKHMTEKGHWFLHELGVEPTNPDNEPDDPRKLQRMNKREIAQMERDKAARQEFRARQKTLFDELAKQKLSEMTTGQKLMMIAVKETNTARIHELVSDGTNPEFHTPDGSTPLHLAALRGNVPVIDLLIRHGAETDLPEVQEIGGSFPIHLAVAEGHTDAVRALLRHGCNVNAQDVDGFTPLHLCARLNRLDIARLLLEAGANGKQIDYGGHAPSYWARRFGHTEMANMLPTFSYSWLEPGKHVPPTRGGKKGASKRKSQFMEQYYKRGRGRGAVAATRGGSRPQSVASVRPRTAPGQPPPAADPTNRIIVQGSRNRDAAKAEVLTQAARIARAVEAAKRAQAQRMAEANEARILELEKRRQENDAIQAAHAAERDATREADDAPPPAAPSPVPKPSFDQLSSNSGKTPATEVQHTPAVSEPATPKSNLRPSSSKVRFDS